MSKKSYEEIFVDMGHSILEESARQRLQAVINKAYGQNGSLPEMDLEAALRFIEFAVPDTAAILQRRTAEMNEAQSEASQLALKLRRARRAWRMLLEVMVDDDPDYDRGDFD